MLILNLEAGQSVIRNRTLAPVFKRMGIIEQWGNGLRIISEELKKYPDIKMEWKEPSFSFRVAFVKSVFMQVFDEAPNTYIRSNYKKTTLVKTSVKTSVKILSLINHNSRITIPEIAKNIGITVRSVERNIEKLQKENKIRRIGADKGRTWEVIKSGK